jgi:hypothetical protein
MRTVKPVYVGTKGLEKPNYGPGYVGFSLNNDSYFSQGIAIFTAEEADTVKFSHSFLVINETSLIESTIGGVQVSPLVKYFDNPHYAVAFKKPKSLDADVTEILLKKANSLVGKEYDYSLITYFFLRKFFWWLERSPLLRKRPSLFNTPDRYLCSEFIAECLNEIPLYHAAKPLCIYHPSKISPMDMVRSENLFNKWKFDTPN